MSISNDIKLINKKENIFGDNIAFVENWDFSKANLSNENRIHAITLIASVCYQNPKALNSDSLYNRLMAESKGLPSSSFEFVPVLLSWQEVMTNSDKIKSPTIIYDDGIIVGSKIDTQTANIEKYGEWIEYNGCKWLLTNYRAVIYDYEQYNDRGVDLRNRFNTEEECQIIAKHFTVLKSHIDLPTFGQFVRHRVNWQVLSRRYVSGKKTPFEFYNSEKMKFSSIHTVGYEDKFTLDENDFIEICLERYNQAIERGVKPEEARRCIPQSAYTTAWCAMQPKQLDNFFKLRLDSHAQAEIRKTAEAIKELLNK